MNQSGRCFCVKQYTATNGVIFMPGRYSSYQVKDQGIEVITDTGNRAEITRREFKDVFRLK